MNKEQEPELLTCNLSDVVDFIGTDLMIGRGVTVVINGVQWTVLPGGPRVHFKYVGKVLSY